MTDLVIPSTKLLSCWPQWKEPVTTVEPQRYGRMTVLAELPRRYSQRIVLCQCDCGTKKTARLVDLKRGQTVSCGCWKRNPRPRKERT